MELYIYQSRCARSELNMYRDSSKQYSTGRLSRLATCCTESNHVTRLRSREIWIAPNRGFVTKREARSASAWLLLLAPSDSKRTRLTCESKSTRCTGS